MTSLNDIIDPLSVIAEDVLSNRARGMQFLEAVAKKRTQFVAEDGARIDVKGGIVVGRNMVGRAREGSFIVDLAGGHFHTHDAVVVGNHVRVKSSGKTSVHGQHARVTASRRRAVATTTINKIDVSRRPVIPKNAPRSSRPRTLAQSRRVSKRTRR